MITTDIYRKPTDTMNYVPFNSAHPKHILKNIPYNLARRITKTVSNTTTRSKRYKELEDRLLELKYPRALIKDAILKATINNRDHKANKEIKILPFILDFNKNSPELFEKVIKPINKPLIKPRKYLPLSRIWTVAHLISFIN